MIWGDAADTRARRVRSGLVLAVAALVLTTGCVATATEARSVAEVASGPTPEASPDPTPVATPVVIPADGPVVGEQTVSGVGPRTEERVPLAVPAAARSVLIDLSCDAPSHFVAELGDAMMLGQAQLSGECDGSRTLAWPWTYGSSGMLWLSIGPEVGWTLSVTYSSEPFVQDADLVEECEAYSQVYSQVSNADDGYGFYAAFGADEWNTRVDAAARSAAALADASDTSLADGFAAMRDVLAERSPIPGGMTEVQEFWEVHRPIAETCAWNHSEIAVYAEFGG
ncbi:hypothetical protein [Microbacterium oleivorans]|uniref:hypothetical protein n=1 Tax=Microbacterium oleivorans TaxID=273677 RepID=UPI000AF9186D|nr:hypothetical protein [Microbacterium oleivorans]